MRPVGNESCRVGKEGEIGESERLLDGEGAGRSFILGRPASESEEDVTLLHGFDRDLKLNKFSPSCGWRQKRLDNKREQEGKERRRTRSVVALEHHRKVSRNIRFASPP